MDHFLATEEQLFKTIGIYLAVMIAAATVVLGFRNFGIITQFLVPTIPVLVLVIVLQCSKSLPKELEKSATQFRADISRAVSSYFFRVFRSIWQTVFLLGDDCDDQVLTVREKEVLMKLEEEWKSEEHIQCELVCESPKEEGSQCTANAPPPGPTYRRRVVRLPPPVRQQQGQQL